jgi:hypothetical protein
MTIRVKKYLFKVMLMKLNTEDKNRSNEAMKHLTLIRMAAGIYDYQTFGQV